MAKYQNPAFDKDRYWESRRQDFMQRKMVRLAKKQQNVVKVHPTVDWPAKLVSKKAILKNSRRARRLETTNA